MKPTEMPGTTSRRIILSFLKRLFQFLGLLPSFSKRSYYQYAVHTLLLSLVCFAQYHVIIRVLATKKTANTLSIAMALGDFIFFIASVTMIVSTSYKYRKLAQLWNFTESCSLHLNDKFWYQLLFHKITNIFLTIYTFYNVFHLNKSLLWEKDGTLNLFLVGICFNYGFIQCFYNGFALLYTTYLTIFHKVLKSVNCSIRDGNELSKHLEFKKTITDACLEINEIFGPGLLALVTVAGVESFYASFVIIAHGVELKHCLWSFYALYNLCMVIHTACNVSYEAARTSQIVILTSLDVPCKSFDCDPEMVCLEQMHDGLEFHALSMIFLEWKLVTTLAGASATYILIFMQFQQQEAVTNGIGKV